MSYRFKYLEKVIGMFLVLAFLIIIISVIFIAKGKQLWVKKVYYYTQFNSAEALSLGMAVKFKGLKIGAVKSIKLDDKNNIIVRFYVLQEYANRVKTDSIIKINAPLIGEKDIAITAGSEKSKVAPKNSFLYSIDTEKGRLLLAEQIKKEPQSPTDLIIQNVQVLTAELSDPKGPFIGTLRNLETFSENFANSFGGDAMRNTIKMLEETARNFRDLSEALKKNPLLGGKASESAKKSSSSKRKR